MKTKTNNAIPENSTTSTMGNADGQWMMATLKNLASKKADGELDDMLEQVQKKSHEDMTAEESLLAEIFHLDGSQPAPEDAQPERVTDFLTKIGQEYKSSVRVTVGDLTGLGRDYARKVLSGMEDTVVHDDGEVFYWKSPRRYAPSIVFTVNDDSRLVFDRYGWFTAAIDYDSADDVLPVLGFDPMGNNENACPIWGETRQKDEWWFSPTLASCAQTLLLGVPWGGAHGSSRGRTEEEAKTLPNVVYFEKQTSKGGGEGVDYYLIKIDPNSELQKAICTSEEKLLASGLKEAQELYVKCLLIKNLDEQCEELRTLIRSEEKRLHDLCTQAEEEVIGELEKAGVDEDDVLMMSGPNPDNVPKVQVEYGYDSSLQELAHARLEIFRIHADLAVAVVQSETRIERHRKFAPKFAKLSSVVRRKCFGWIEIYEGSVDVLLPNEESVEPEMVCHRFGFTEKQLKNCMDLVQSCIDDELKASTKNTETLNKLLK